jgi:hypothetical protein
MKMNPVVHFEMPAKNNKRVKKFYEKVFSWQMLQLGKEMENYILAGTTPLDKNRMPKNPGAINGGFFRWGKDGKHPHVVIAVDNLKKHITIVKRNGGKILTKIMPIQGIGTFAMFKDTEGNKVGMLQPAPMRKK